MAFLFYRDIVRGMASHRLLNVWLDYEKNSGNVWPLLRPTKMDGRRVKSSWLMSFAACRRLTITLSSWRVLNDYSASTATRQDTWLALVPRRNQTHYPSTVSWSTGKTIPAKSPSCPNSSYQAKVTKMAATPAVDVFNRPPAGRVRILELPFPKNRLKASGTCSSLCHNRRIHACSICLCLEITRTTTYIRKSPTENFRRPLLTVMPFCCATTRLAATALFMTGLQEGTRLGYTGPKSCPLNAKRSNVWLPRYCASVHCWTDQSLSDSYLCLFFTIPLFHPLRSVQKRPVEHDS